MTAVLAPNAAMPLARRKEIFDRMGKDMAPAEFEALRGLLGKWLDEEEKEPEHAGDSALALAFDRDSVRSKRKDGQLAVERAHITKATVNPYLGSEIPGYQRLGLAPDKVYNLLRHPEELKKATNTLNGVQLLRKHVPVNAEDHRPYDTVGSLGTDAEFVEEDGENFLDNSLFVNAQDAIDDIESGRKKQLSAGYHYKPDMTPGIFKGKSYDGVMRDIVFNHVALVEDGRAGDQVVVGDSAEKIRMSKPTRIAAYALQSTAAVVAPLLAMDKKIELPSSLFKTLTSKNFAESKPKLVDAIKLAMDGKLRKSITLDGAAKHVSMALDELDDLTKGYDESVSEPQHKAMEAAAHGNSTLGIPESVGKEFAQADKGKTFDAEPIKAFLKSKGMADDDISKVCDMLPKPALDQIPGEKEGKTLEEEAAGSKAEGPDATGPEKDGMVTKPAMDQAISAAVKSVRATEQGIRTALANVKPWVGDLPATMAFDSAADVYRHVLKMKGVEGATTMHADALLPVLKAIPVPGSKPAPQHQHTSIAQDSSAFGKAKKYAPGLENIQQV